MLCYTQDYKKDIAIAKPYLPKGCRFIKEGEVIPAGASYIDNYGWVFQSDCNLGDTYRARTYIPCFVKVAAKKTAPKPADRLSELEKEVRELRAELKALKEGIRKAVG